MEAPMNTRSRVLCSGLAALAVLSLASAASAQEDFAGRWRTNQGAMRLDQDGGRVRGEYELKDGRVRGEVDGDTVNGIWTQSSSNHRCLDERMDSRYWGRFWFQISRDGTQFRGRWSYCEDEPGSGGDWTGERY
jgi:hypothetical protein